MILRLACGKEKILSFGGAFNIFYVAERLAWGSVEPVRLYFIFSCGASFLDFGKILTNA
jgi:hypothetical protein